MRGLLHGSGRPECRATLSLSHSTDRSRRISRSVFKTLDRKSRKANEGCKGPIRSCLVVLLVAGTRNGEGQYDINIGKLKSSKPTACEVHTGTKLVRRITNYPVRVSGSLNGKNPRRPRSAS